MPSELVMLSRERVSLLDGSVTVTPRATVDVHDLLSDGARYTIEVVFDAALERFVAESVRVERASAGHEVTARVIREVRVQEVIADVALRMMTHVMVSDVDGEDDPDFYSEVSGAEYLERIAPAAGRDVSFVRDDALRISTLAKLGSWPPLVTVAERLGVSHSTAKRLVAAAEERTPLLGFPPVNLDG